MSDCLCRSYVNDGGEAAMSVRDIIKAACEVYDDRASLMVTWMPRCKESAVVMEDYRRIVHPEHVALMEAERVAARHLRSTPEYQAEAIARYEDACEATDRYRKERGL